jgi:RHS repeat-associated protein
VAAIENATANPCTTCYLTYDHLGTVRLVTDAAANVMGRHDYLPFGDEIPGGVAGRSSQFGPYVDSVNQKFTGQYRDSETSNDFFNARYFSAPLMRFLSTDPAGLAAVDMTDPQTWNQYSYVRGNPLNSVDPSGMLLDVPPGVGIGWDPCDVDSWDPSDDPPPCGVSIPIVPPIAVGGGGGGRGGGHSGSSGGSGSGDGGLTPSSPPFPPGSFPGGENLGLPPGLSVPGPWGWQNNPFVFSAAPAALGTLACIPDPGCWVPVLAGAALAGSWILIEEMNKGVFHPSSDWQYSGPQIIIQQPTISLMAKGGKQNIDNEYTRDVKALGSLIKDPCKYLRDLYNSTRDPRERQKINAARKYFNCDSKDRYQ